jgi:hypothetical protein
VKRAVGGVGEAVEVDGVLWAWRRWRAPGKRSRSMSGVEGETVEATACSRGEAVEGTLRRGWRAPSVVGVEYLKRVSGKNLLSVERAARALDIYIGGQMRDTRSLRCVAHLFRRIAHYF